MEYYLIMADTDIPIAVSPFDIWDIKQDRAHKLPGRELLFFHGNSFTTFNDILLQPFLLVSEKIQSVIALYEPETVFTEIVLMDTFNELAELYFCPELHEVDCLTEQSKFIPDRNVIKKAVIDVSKIGDKKIFSLAGVQGFHVVGRRDFIESVLSRDARGLVLFPIETINEG
ncbi:hypothetical protein [Lacrimispora sp.]|uniref:hypothetical protein n=1 Tax=Lacrimispora sp. TaxID=2719234 RepID=UPI002899F724|nr:hypothetical protein [Lacrimispora sp.]